MTAIYGIPHQDNHHACQGMFGTAVHNDIHNDRHCPYMAFCLVLMLTLCIGMSYSTLHAMYILISTIFIAVLNTMQTYQG